MRSRFEVKCQMVGGGMEEVREARILNRIIRWTREGWEYEADQRHADLILQDLNLKDCNAVTTPGEDKSAKPAVDDEA